MDIGTFIGLVFGIAVVLMAILIESDLLIFLNIPGLLIVLGGTLAATLVKFPLATVVLGLKVGVKAAFGNHQSDPRNLIDQALELARLNRRRGPLALQDADIDNEFFAHGIQLYVDGFERDVIRSTLTKDMNINIQRQEAGERVFRAFGESAPAFGMIGTLVGLVQMLSQMDDPGSIGPAMAIALLTTLYGALIANLVALPIADKLEEKAEQQRLSRTLIIEAVTEIAAKQSPEPLAEILEVYLPEKQRTHDEIGAGEPRPAATEA